MYSFFRESLIHFSSTTSLPSTHFRQSDPVISCLSFTICFAIQKISFWWLGSFKSLTHSFCFFSFANEISLFVFCLLFLYSFHASFHTFSSFLLLLHQSARSTTMFPYVCIDVLTIHMWSFNLLPVFIYIKVIPLRFLYLIFFAFSGRQEEHQPVKQVLKVIWEKRVAPRRIKRVANYWYCTALVKSRSMLKHGRRASPVA